MIEETRRPNPKSRGERTRRRQRIMLNSGKDVKPLAVSPISISPTKTLVQLENQRNNNVSPKSATLPLPKKRKGSLTRLLSFGKNKKKEGLVTSLDSSGVEGSQETLSEEVGVVSGTLAAVKKEESLDSSGVEGSRETVCESLEVPSPGPAPRLHKTLRASSVIELASDSKVTALLTAEDDSTDSFKSADSPVLCNTVKEPAVDSARQGGLDSDVYGECLTESAFTVFAESQFVKELTTPKPKKRSVWKRLLSREKVVVYSKTPSDLLDTHVDGGSAMSQNQTGIRKERARGRGTAPGRKVDKADKTPEKQPQPPPPETPPPSTSSPQPPPQSPSPQPAPPDEDTLRKSAAIGSQILQQKKEEGKRVSGDDLRKQLTEGLKNGSGKSKDVGVKAQLSEITQGAAKTSASETQSFLEKERKNKEDKKEAVKDKPQEEKPSDLQKQQQQKQKEEKTEPSASQADNTPVPSTSNTTEQAKQDMPPAESKKEHLYKILVIGELGTGKTSIIKRYVHQFFSQHYRATIGVDFALKVLNWDENSIIRLQLWDIAGQERFGNMTRVYYKEAVGAFIVFDVTRAATFDAVQKWKQDLDSKVQLSDGSPIPCILLANKCDQPKEGLVNNKGKMDEYCRENGFAGWFETSAKENINIEDAARALVLKILQNDKLIRTGERSQDSERIALDGASEGSGGKSCSC